MTPLKKPKTNGTKPCGDCKSTCHLICQETTMNNKITGKPVNITSGGNCKSKNLVYAVRCKLHDKIYVGQTGDELSKRISKNRYVTKRRPNNNELSKHFASEKHNFERDIEIT